MIATLSTATRGVLSRVKRTAKTFLARYPRFRRLALAGRTTEVHTSLAETSLTPSNTPSASDVVAKQWDQLANEEFVRDLTRRSWTGIPEVHLNHNYRVTGDRNIYWVSWLRERYFSDGFAGDTLSLGCGEGNVDRVLKDCGFTFRSFTGLDISPKAIERACKLADEKGGLAPRTTYATADLNVHTLPKTRSVTTFSNPCTILRVWNTSSSNAYERFVLTGS